MKVLVNNFKNMECRIVVFLLQISFVLSNTAEHFNYRTPEHWKTTFPQCGGHKQSPIALNYSEAVQMNIPPLSFINYDVSVSGNVKAINNGHTVQIDIPTMDNKKSPYVYGAGLYFDYVVKGFHFHWGSPGISGSEHSIDGKKYDMELHIVHKKIPYNTLKEASSDPYGMLVLAVLFQGVQDDEAIATDLDEFYEALPLLTESGSHMDLKLMKMEQFLEGLQTDKFYMYNGSLTTPPCPEAAVWFVFPHILSIQQKYLERFWKLHDSESELLLHNQRPIQPTNSRSVYYRNKSIS